jgi:MFS-type transporter involved in bile tolerance (Atg22 family)
MSNSPGPLNKQNLSRATIAGSALAAGGIILFLILYYALANAGVDALSRVVLALCVPPAVMAVLVGGYVLFGKKNKSD